MNKETTPVTVPGEQREVWTCDVCLTCDPKHCKCNAPKVEQRGDTADGIGWCSSCNLVHEVQRPKCPKCDDWLIFAVDDKPEPISETQPPIETCWCGIEREDHREHYLHPFEPMMSVSNSEIAQPGKIGLTTTCRHPRLAGHPCVFCNPEYYGITIVYKESEATHVKP